MPQTDLNAAVWRAGNHVSEYDSRILEPAEVLLLVRYREAFSGRVLDVGCGAGRLLGYLASLSATAVGVDISPAMVDACRRRFPGADVRVADLEDLPRFLEGPFDVVLMSDNVLDVFDDARRRAVLADIRGLLADRGLLVFSSHNLARWERAASVGVGATAGVGAGAGSGARLGRARSLLRRLLHQSPAWMLNALVRLARRRSNRRRLGPMQHRAADHAVVNDEAHNYSLLHYYIARGDQERQLADLGYDLIDVLEFDGASVPAGADGVGASLYYVATAR
jgi:SAM-dependent methyltransferase